MRQYLCLTIGLLCAALCASQDSIAPRTLPILTDMPYVHVSQDKQVERLLEDKIYGPRATKEIDGYRVQIYSSNRQQVAKNEALELETLVKEKLSCPIYVQYLPPFWKVRLGDFQTYDEANLFKKEVLHIFPEKQGDTYIVRDKIKVQR